MLTAFWAVVDFLVLVAFVLFRRNRRRRKNAR